MSQVWSTIGGNKKNSSLHTLCPVIHPSDERNAPMWQYFHLQQTPLVYNVSAPHTTPSHTQILCCPTLHTSHSRPILPAYPLSPRPYFTVISIYSHALPPAPFLPYYPSHNPISSPPPLTHVSRKETRSLPGGGQLQSSPDIYG